VHPTAAFQAVSPATAASVLRPAAGTIDPGHPAPRSVSAPAGTAHVPMSEIHQSIARLRPLFDAYRGAWAQLAAAIEQTTAVMEPGTRQFTLTVLQRELPGVAHEPQFNDIAQAAGVAVSAAPARASTDDSAAVTKLAEALRPGEDPPHSPQEAARFLRCVEDVMRASAKAFVELQKGQEQFGNEMGVRTIKEFTPLHAAGTADNVLRYLLDWQAGGPHRTQELVGVYADLMIHQVALINGVMEGARGLLARLDPGELERSVTSSWPTRAAALWKHFTQRHRELLDDDRRLTEAIFGPEFARAYAEVGGEGAGRR
jgi:type VI secretion system protein